MPSPAAAARVDAPSALAHLLALLDRPARSALELARQRMHHTLLPGLIGLGLCAVACAVADALGDDSALALHGLRALIEALLVIVPTSLIAFTFLQMRVPPRAFVASAALGLLIAGVMGLSLLPLLVFARAAGQGALPFVAEPAVVLPFTLVLGAAAMVLRVVRAIDPRDIGRGCSMAFFVVLVGAFVLRFQPALIHAANARGLS